MIRIAMMLVLVPTVVFALGREENYSTQNQGVYESTWDRYSHTDKVEPACSTEQRAVTRPVAKAPPRMPVTYLTNPKVAKALEAKKRAAILKAKRDLGAPAGEPTDEEIAKVNGVQPTGDVKNDTQTAFTLTLDSFAAWVQKTNRLKVGVSLGDERLTWYPLGPDHPVTATLDVAENLVGGSLNLVLVPVVRVALGLGYAHLFDTHDNTIYGVGRVRLW